MDGPEGRGNIALRLPRDVVGIDVDNYGGKQGGATITAAVARWGSLPLTWRSTNRPAGQGSILFYRAPEGLVWPGELGPGVEIIQYAHRYAVVWPSIHPEGRGYRWVSPEGAEGETVPRPDQLPLLPDAWVEGLTSGELQGEIPHAGIDDQAVSEWLDEYGDGEPCTLMRHCLDSLSARFDGKASRHEAARDLVRRITAMGAEGHAGMTVALHQVEHAFRASLNGDTDRPADPGEWRRLVDGAVQIAAANSVVEYDPCRPYRIPPLDENSLAGKGETSPKGRRIVTTQASTMKAEPVSWGWQDRIQRVALTIFAGRESTGKSSCTMWMTAQLTKGMLPGEFYGSPRNVMVGAIEDSWVHIILPRLIAAGADLSRVYRVEVAEGESEGMTLVLPMDIDRLKDEVLRLDVAALIIDPLMSNIDGSLNTNNSREARKALDPLNMMAEQAKIMAIGVCHFNKSSGTDISSLISGSGAFKDAARSVLGFVHDAEQNIRVMQQTKNSGGRLDLPSLSYVLTPISVPTDLGPSETVRFDWTGVSDRSATQVLRDVRSEADPDRGSDKHSQTTRCVEWLSAWINLHGEVVAGAKRVIGSEAKAAARDEEHDWGRKVWRGALDKLHIDASTKTKETKAKAFWIMPPAPMDPISYSGPHSGPNPENGEGQCDEGQCDEVNESGASEGLSTHSGPRLREDPEQGATVAPMPYRDDTDDDPDPPMPTFSTDWSCVECGSTQGMANHGGQVFCTDHTPTAGGTP